MASHNPYRFVVYALLIIMAATVIIDCIVHRITWTGVFFYSLTLALTIFRIFGRNGATIVIHVVSTLTILLMVYAHYYDEFHDPDVDFYVKGKSLSLVYGLLDKTTKMLPHRANFMAFWLTYPMAYLAIASIAGFLLILNLSLNVRKMFAGLHGTLGHTISMIYFLICSFYSPYFKSFDLSVAMKMLYYLMFLLIMLCPSLASYSQIFSKHYTDEPEEEDVEDDEDVVVAVVEEGKAKKDKKEKKVEKRDERKEEKKKERKEEKKEEKKEERKEEKKEERKEERKEEKKEERKGEIKDKDEKKPKK